MTHLILLTIPIAATFAIYEAQLIAKRTKAGEREHIDHAELMGWRAAAWIVGAILLMAFDVVTWQTALRSILPCLATFAIVHRFALNKARKMPWWWMGPMIGWRHEKASKYDGLWHSVAWWCSGLKYGAYGEGAANDPDYPKKMPARLAYGFESVVIATFAVLHYVIP